mmetsp:Transcript_15281/g.36360  ORF Transcript_15281/g.36360 Transcript_15281/m.36360 type:complete len:380 (+) Transcript_15281:516-1655(+)
MRCYASPKRAHYASVDAVPALKDAHYPPAAARVGDLADLVRQPLKVRLGDAEVPEVDLVLRVGVEPGRDQDEVRAEGHDCGEDLVPPGPAPELDVRPGTGDADVDDARRLSGSDLGVRRREELPAGVLGEARGVEDRGRGVGGRLRPRVGGRAGARVHVRVEADVLPPVPLHTGKEDVVRVLDAEPRLVARNRLGDRAEGRLVGEGPRRRDGADGAGLGAVAVVHIEVEYHDPPDLTAPLVEGVRGAHGDVVDEAEAEGPVWVVLRGDHAGGARVVPRRPHGAERVLRLPLDDAVDGAADGARRHEPRPPRPVRDGRVGVEVAHARGVVGDLCAGRLYALEVTPLVDPQDVGHLCRPRLCVDLKPRELACSEGPLSFVE